ncbi:MAG: ATP-binding protein [Candidatus Omnitrophota bacterium]|nr:hypothetical protein [Candidatus Omnitrophota bacterium]
MKFQGVVKYVYKQMGRAINERSLLSGGDKILVGVSGSAKSLVMLELLFERQRRVPLHFEIIPCFVQTDPAAGEEHSLRRYLESLGTPCVMRELALAPVDGDAFWCSWEARKVIFAAARQFSCNKIALGHDLDDIIETTMMNILFKGSVSAPRPKIELFGGKLTVIRPLCYVEHKSIQECYAQCSFPCASRDHLCKTNSTRGRMREILNDVLIQYPFIKTNIFRSLDRIRGDYTL